ncbi:MAG: hypothetical protein R2939_07365 [Kofleriaceae bacterium]
MPPELEITSPTRGTFAEGDLIEVRGVVRDDAAAPTVTVNGVAAEVASDGQFRVVVPVAAGVSILETVADDGAHQVKDVRAVLAGELRPVTEPVVDALGAQVSPAAFAALSSVLTDTLSALDLNALAKAHNPLYDNGGCLGAKVNIVKATTTGAHVALVPAADGLATEVAIDGLDVIIGVKYKVACIGDSTVIRVRADQVRVRGDLTLAVDDGVLAAGLDRASVALPGFSIQTGGLPGVIVGLLDGKIKDAVEDALLDVVRDELPGLAADALNELTGGVQTVDALGHELALGLVPRTATIDAAGLRLSLDASAVVSGGEGAVYAATATPLAGAMDGGAGMAVAIADDALNQVLAGLWSVGAIDLALPEDVAATLALLIDDEVATVTLSPTLPPSARAADGALAVTLGDLILTARAADGEALAELALSIETGLAVEPTAAGGLRLALGEPRVWAQVLVESARVDRPLAADEFEDVVGAAWGLLGPALGEALDAITVPSIAGVSVIDAAVAGRDGYLVVEASLSAP